MHILEKNKYKLNDRHNIHTYMTLFESKLREPNLGF
jgi:hypothetical protein